MNDEREVKVALTVRDSSGEMVAPTALEKLDSALALLGKALESPEVMSSATDVFPPEVARESVVTGLRLLIAGCSKLDPEAKRILGRHATALLRQLGKLCTGHVN